ncbi:unnamed protein product [Ectocarpus sp. 8 AP-2014]
MPNPLQKHDMFSATRRAHLEELEMVVEEREGAMKMEWEGVAEGWRKLEQLETESGMLRSTFEDDTLTLNVGGSNVDISRADLQRLPALSEAWKLANLFDRDWDERLPRDANGLMVLDESPVCFKHLVDALGGVLPTDEQAYLPYVSNALGVPSPARVPRRRVDSEGSAMLGVGGELDRLARTVLDWCPGNPERLDLLYRASRDGWDTKHFHARCGDDSPMTVTLYRLNDASNRKGLDCSVLGCFSSVPWTPPSDGSTERKSSPGGFVSILTDGSRSFRPTKSEVHPRYAKRGCGVVVLGEDSMPSFHDDLEVLHEEERHRSRTSSTNAKYRLWTDSGEFYVPEGCSFLEYDGIDVAEIEVYRLWSAEEERSDDVHRFGGSIAASFEEEHKALQKAQSKLVEATEKGASSASALAAVYGPDVASNNRDLVVDFSVRGSRTTTRITTLRSTLQLCPYLVARLDRSKWTENKDKHGRWLIKDCSPAVFSKVLDVLRMKKRAGWIGGEAKARVAVKATDREAFEQAVDMYFPGCERVILDHVEFLGEAGAACSSAGANAASQR